MCSYVEHMCFLELCLRLILLPLSNFSQPAAVPILLFFPRLFLVYSSSFYPDSSSTVCLSIALCCLCCVWAILCHFLFFICCSIGICFVLCHSSQFEVSSSCLRFQMLLSISLQMLGENCLSIELFSTFHTCTIRLT